MGNSKLLITIFVLVAAFGIHEGQAVKCYHCNDIEIPGSKSYVGINKCPNFTFGYNFKVERRECPNGCMKATFIGTGAHVRGCLMTKGYSPIGCKTNFDPKHGTATICRCDGRLCNSGVSLAPIGTLNMAAVIIFTTPLFIYWKL